MHFRGKLKYCQIQDVPMMGTINKNKTKQKIQNYQISIASLFQAVVPSVEQYKGEGQHRVSQNSTVPEKNFTKS